MQLVLYVIKDEFDYFKVEIRNSIILGSRTGSALNSTQESGSAQSQDAGAVRLKKNGATAGSRHSEMRYWVLKLEPWAA
jgi:hypothetical protein